MLIEFSVGNYLSFKKMVTLSMVASSIREHREKNVFSVGNLNLLKSAVIYGANASGKSNIFKAIEFMKEFVFDSSKDRQATEEIEVENFKLSTETEGLPSYFEIIFTQNNSRYRYGFEVDFFKVHNEWLFYAPQRTKESRLFIREGNDFLISESFKEGKGLQSKTRENALFLSVVAQFNGEISTEIIQWFRKLNVVSGLMGTPPHQTAIKLEDDNYKRKVLDFLKVADLGIEEISTETVNITNNKDFITRKKRGNIFLSKDGIYNISTFTKHKKYDNNNSFFSYETFELEKNESEGTKKLLSLSVPIIEAIKEGKVLVIDELDSKMHSLLTRFIINLFNTKDENKLNAQLIFNTHDTTILEKKFFRRDQIWFCEKDRYGATDLFSLVEYKTNDGKIRNDASYGKDYILGKYGAIPLFGELDIFKERDGE